MIKFNIFGFPVEVHWPFWITTAILGGAATARGPESIQLLLLWTAIVFVSIIVHELGHALAMRHFGDRVVSITLYSFGGFARGSAWRTRTESFIISAAGPVFSLLLGVLGWVVGQILPPTTMDSWLYQVALADWAWVNFGWTVLNVLPILPLDGGQMTEALLGPDKIRTTLWLGVVCAGLVALWSLSSSMIFTALFFGMLALNNWKQLNHQQPIDWMRP